MSQDSEARTGGTQNGEAAEHDARWSGVPVPGGRARTPLLAVIAVILAAGALKLTALVTLPVAFAFFVALVVWPVDCRVAEMVPKPLAWVGHVAAMAVVLICIAIFVAGMTFVAQRLAAELPTIAQGLEKEIKELSRTGEEGVIRRFVINAFGQSSTGEGQSGEASGLAGFVIEAARRALRSLGVTLSLVTLIFFFALIMLTEKPVWKAKLRGAWGDGESVFLRIVETAGQRFRWYLLVRGGVGLLTAALYGIWLYLFDLQLIWVWIVLTFLLGFVPTLGSLISGLLPFALALATKDVGTAFLIGAGLLLIEQVMGNYVDPKLQGKQLSLSPFVVLLSILVWGFIWGVGGALIAVPMTVLIVIGFSYVDPLRPIALMLSGTSSYEALDESVTPDRPA